MRILLVIFLLSTGLVWADRNDGGAGVVYGPGHAYWISAPLSWIFDNESGVGQGLHAVIYPKGSDWGQSPVVLYSSATAKGLGQTVHDIIKDDLAKFREHNPAVHMVEMAALTTKDGRQAEVREFTGDQWNNHEMVAYVDTPQVVCEIVMSARTDSAFQQGLPCFRHVVNSFLYLSPGDSAPPTPSVPQPSQTTGRVSRQI